ncbi:hypothetical protein LCGC14_0290520 [marine sediment metagenome]|uniref:Type I restriction modification DNA specificity domain-containing protein n=1 Tax=marine sediment metagenome TaxID=412755 RepID=A0A0F9WYW3_9ZZZZ|nr:restriction endonuclease subunit S [archaeon]
MISRLLNIKVPESWEIRKLNEISEIIMGQSPPSSTYNINSDGLPFFQGNADFGYYNPKVKVWCNSPKKIAQPNDILVSVRAPVGAINIADVESCIGRGLSAVRVDHRYDMKYIYYFLNHFNKVFSRLKQGSTFEAITKEELINFPLLLPQNLKEQQLISSILYNIDELIFKTQDLIKSFQILKKSLMQRLFTEGIGHTEFKETKGGKIPKSWNVLQLKKIGRIFTGKTPSTLVDDYWGDDIPFITPGDITNKHYIRKTERFVSFLGANQSKLITENGICTVCIGSTVGKVALAVKDSITNQQINSMICNENNDPHYICYAISNRSRYLKTYAGVAAVPIVKKSLFESFRIPVPSTIEEQKSISNILLSIDNNIEIEEKYQNRLKEIKKGLMQDLLTGKKRVKIN